MKKEELSDFFDEVDNILREKAKKVEKCRIKYNHPKEVVMSIEYMPERLVYARCNRCDGSYTRALNAKEIKQYEKSMKMMVY